MDSTFLASHHLAPILRNVNCGAGFPFFNLREIRVIPHEGVASGEELVIYYIIDTIMMQF